MPWYQINIPKEFIFQVHGGFQQPPGLDVLKTIAWLDGGKGIIFFSLLF